MNGSTEETANSTQLVPDVLEKFELERFRMCRKCKKNKNDNEFLPWKSQDERFQNTRSSICDECKKIPYQLPEEVRYITYKKYQIENREKINKDNNEHYHKNKEKILQREQKRGIKLKFQVMKHAPIKILHKPTIIDESTVRCCYCDIKYPNVNKVCFIQTRNIFGEIITLKSAKLLFITFLNILIVFT